MHPFTARSRLHINLLVLAGPITVELTVSIGYSTAGSSLQLNCGINQQHFSVTALLN